MLNEKEEILTLIKIKRNLGGLLNVFAYDLVLNCGVVLLLVEIPWKHLIILRHLDMVFGFVMEMAT